MRCSTRGTVLAFLEWRTAGIPPATTKIPQKPEPERPPIPRHSLRLVFLERDFSLTCSLFSRTAGSTYALRSVVAARRIGVIVLLISVVVPPPRHRERQAFFLPAPRRQVQVAIHTHQRLTPAPIRRIGVKHLPLFVLIKHADARSLFTREILLLEVVVHLALRYLLLAERNVIVAVELIPV